LLFFLSIILKFANALVRAGAFLHPGSLSIRSNMQESVSMDQAPWICRRGRALMKRLRVAAVMLALLPVPMHGQGSPVSSAVVELLAVGPTAKGKNLECGATGFLVNAQGYILTNAHVVEESRKCLAGSPGGKILARPAAGHPSIGNAVSCVVVEIDELHDVALLKAERPLFATPAETQNNVAPLHEADIDDGAEVAVAGHPNFEWNARIQTGRIVRHTKFALSDSSSQISEVLIVDVALRKGTSGSPVYLASGGGVVGIAERKDVLHPSHAVAVPVRYAIELLDLAGVRWIADTK
jgi:S1-C subfamily serine protease